jgi:hypothetical protein
VLTSEINLTKDIVTEKDYKIYEGIARVKKNGAAVLDISFLRRFQ